MNILLTGGAGYIGSHTAVVLAQAGHQVVLFDNFCNSQRSVVENLQKLLGFPVLCVEGDVRNTQCVTETLISNKIDTVIHFAGLKAVGESNQMPLTYYSNNVKGTLSLLEAMQSAGVKRLVFSSSATVYGDPQYLPIDEGHPVAPSSPYGRTKQHIEQILMDLCDSDAAWTIACLRYFNPAGAHDSGLIRESPNGTPNNLFPYICRVSTGDLECLHIFGTDYPTVDGTGVRDYIHVMDLAEAHLVAATALHTLKGCSFYNIGTGKGSSVFQIIREFEQSRNVKISCRLVERRKGDVAACYASVSKVQLELGWAATRDLRDICTTH
jgi:UDP-glucose 4-epimerase